MLKFQDGWNNCDPKHPLNTEDAIRGLFGSFNILRGDVDWAAKIRGFLTAPTVDVLVYKGFHQDKFFSRNDRDRGRIDQAHFNIVVQGRVCHVYVQPNLAQKYDITEITNAPPKPAPLDATAPSFVPKGAVPKPILNPNAPAFVPGGGT